MLHTVVRAPNGCVGADRRVCNSLGRVRFERRGQAGKRDRPDEEGMAGTRVGIAQGAERRSASTPIGKPAQVKPARAPPRRGRVLCCRVPPAPTRVKGKSVWAMTRELISPKRRFHDRAVARAAAAGGLNGAGGGRKPAGACPFANLVLAETDYPRARNRFRTQGFAVGPRDFAERKFRAWKIVFLNNLDRPHGGSSSSVLC